MRTPEREDQLDAGDHEPYVCAARFQTEPLSRRAYTHAREAIFAPPSNLSAYRFLLDRLWYVAVLGDAPDEILDRRLRRILAVGEPTILPDEILTVLWARRVEISSPDPRAGWFHGGDGPG